MNEFRETIWIVGWLSTWIGAVFGVTNGFIFAVSQWTPHVIHVFVGLTSASVVLLIGGAIASSLARVDL